MFFVTLSHKRCTVSSEYVISDSPHLFLISYSSCQRITKSYYFPAPQNHRRIFVCFFFLIFNFMYYFTSWLCWLSSVGFPLVSAGRGPSLAVACAPHCSTSAAGEHGFWGAQASVAAARGLLRRGSQAPETAQRLRRMGLVALQYVGSSRTRGQTHSSRVGRWILYPWATGKPITIFFNQNFHALESELGYLWETGERPVVPQISLCFSRKGKTAPPANWNNLALGNGITRDTTNPWKRSR